MTYMLMFYENKETFDTRNLPEKSNAYWGAWMSYIGAIRESGLMVSGNGLQPPSTASTLQNVDGKRVVQDGPIADTKEQLAGYVVMNVPDLDAALEWASRVPGTAAVEVRPVMPPPPQG